MAAQHVSDEQDEGRADAFSTCGQQVFEGSAQVRVAFGSLGAHPVFDQQNLFLDGGNKGYVIQGSPLKKSGRIGGCGGGDLFHASGLYLCNFISNFHDKGRFVAFAPMGDGGEEGRIGFDEQTGNW